MLYQATSTCDRVLRRLDSIFSLSRRRRRFLPLVQRCTAVERISEEHEAPTESPLPLDCFFFIGTGMNVEGDQTYALVTPTILAVSSRDVTLSWSAPVDTGKSPVTGYHVYMFDGVGLNSQADPQPVKHEIQVNVKRYSNVQRAMRRRAA